MFTYDPLSEATMNLILEMINSSQTKYEISSQMARFAVIRMFSCVVRG